MVRNKLSLIIFGVVMLAFGFAAFSGAQSNSAAPAPLQFQNATTPIGTAPILNCSTGMTCTKSGNVINATASGTGGSVTSVTCGTGLTGGTITTTGTCAIDANSQIRSIGAGFDGGGSALTSGTASTAYFTVPFGCTISAWNATVDAGTITFDIWKIATGTAIPTVANTITASALPAIATGTALHSTTLTGWTTSVSANDIFGVEINAAATATKASLILQCNAS